MLSRVVGDDMGKGGNAAQEPATKQDPIEKRGGQEWKPPPPRDKPSDGSGSKKQS